MEERRPPGYDVMGGIGGEAIEVGADGSGGLGNVDLDHGFLLVCGLENMQVRSASRTGWSLPLSMNGLFGLMAFPEVKHFKAARFVFDSGKACFL